MKPAIGALECMAMMALVIVLFVVAVIVASSVMAQRRKRAVLQRMLVMSETLAGTGSPLTVDLSKAMRDALQSAGLPPDSVQVRTSIQTTAGPVGVTMAGAGAGGPGLDLERLGVAEVVSISSLTGQRVAALELDAIGAPKRRVTADLGQDQPLERGERVYVLTDPAKPDLVEIAPPSATGGAVLPQGPNRLDPLVLGPQLLKAGAKGKGVVKSVEAQDVPQALAARGLSRWRLEIEVTPEHGWPFRAELETTVSTPQKVAQICHAGAEVAIRYDPKDTKTIGVDSVAMGYGDPYEHLQAAAGVSPEAGPLLAGPGANPFDGSLLRDLGEIERIKLLRHAMPGLGLREAKDMVEGKTPFQLSAEDAVRIQQAMLAAFGGQFRR
ncbi:MAG: hypothetical protein WA840_12455 [Caulobacteraceae bacterium]